MEGTRLREHNDSPPGAGGSVGRSAVRAGVFLAARTVAVRLLGLLGTLVLARVLEPRDFGVFAIVAALVTLMSAVGDVGLGASLIQQPAEPTRRELSTVWTAQMAFAVAGAVAIVLAAPFAAGVVSGLGAEAEVQLRVLAIGLPLAALRSMPTVMLERSMRYGPIARTEIAGQAAFYAVAIPLALAGFGAWSLVDGALAQAVLSTVLINAAWHAPHGVAVDLAALRRLLRFGIAYQAAYAVTWAREGLLPPIVGLAADTVAAGVISIALRISAITASVEEIVARLTLPMVSRLQTDPKLVRRGLNEASALSLVVVAPVQLWIAVAAPIGVPLVLSDRWAAAVLPLQLISIALILRIPARILRQVAFAIGRARAAVGLSLATSLAPLALAYPLALAWGLDGAGAGVLLGAAIGLAVVVAMAPFRGVLELVRLTRIVIVAALAAGVSALPLLAAGGPLALVLSGVVMAVTYLPLAWGIERPAMLRTWRYMRSMPR